MRITVDSVEVRSSMTLGRYAYGKALISKPDGATANMVFMSFGSAFESVRNLLIDGATIEVNAVVDGSILRILSPVVVAHVSHTGRG